MKITKEMLKKIILEELEDDGFGKQRASRGVASKDLANRSREMQKQNGVDDLERGIIGQLEKLLTALADKVDIKSGSTKSKLEKIYQLLKKDLEAVNEK